jgi:hypothetical protein
LRNKCSRRSKPEDRVSEHPDAWKKRPFKLINDTVQVIDRHHVELERTRVEEQTKRDSQMMAMFVKRDELMFNMLVKRDKEVFKTRGGRFLLRTAVAVAVIQTMLTMSILFVGKGDRFVW